MRSHLNLSNHVQSRCFVNKDIELGTFLDAVQNDKLNKIVATFFLFLHK